MPHFKGLGMRNLQQEIRICQKSHDTLTITVYLHIVLFGSIFNETDVTTN